MTERHPIMSLQLNLDWETRDKTIFGNADIEKYSGGIRHFEGISLNTLKWLLKERFADPADRQNESPTLKEFVEFAESLPDHLDVEFDGYVVSYLRDDYRVTVDALTIYAEDELTVHDIQLMRSLTKNADDSHVTQDSFWAWWD